MRPPRRLDCSRLQVSPFIYALSWWFVLTVHLLNGTLVFIIGVIYLYFSQTAVFHNVSLLQISQSTLQLSGWSYLALATIHGYAVTGMVVRTLRAGQLTLLDRQSTPSSNQILKDDFAHQQTMTAAIRTKMPSWSNPRVWRAMLEHKYALAFGIDGLFGVNGKYFYQALIVREYIEIGLQTYQAHQLSRSVARTAINTLAVLIVVLNCISSPVVFHMYRKQEIAGRLVIMLVDMVLDFTTATVVPLAVVYPHLRFYDTSTGVFPAHLLHNDVWFSGVMEEIRQFCVTSLLDYVASLLPHASVLGCLSVFKSVIRRHTSSKRRLSIQLTGLTNIMGDSPTSSRDTHYVPVITSRSRISFHTLVSCAWIIFIVATHIHAQRQGTQSTSEVQDCRLPLQPWFASRVACAVVQVNCYRDGTVGTADDITKRLGVFDRTLVQKIIITHCSALEMPPILQEFRELTDFVVHNVTLTAWPAHAALTSTSNPRVSTIELFEIRFGCFPHGMFHDEMPTPFSFFTLAKSNVTELPENIGSLWQRVNFQVVNIQLTDLQHLPSTFNLLKIKRMLLISNGITTIADDTFTSEAFQFTGLHLSGNPLIALPSSIGDTSVLKELVVEDTRVSVLSDQIASWLQIVATDAKPVKLSFSGSPVCQSPSLSAATLDQLCGNRLGNAVGTIPWDLLASQRPLQ